MVKVYSFLKGYVPLEVRKRIECEKERFKDEYYARR